MDTTERAAGSDLTGKVLEDPSGFSFFQLIGLLERSVPGSVPVGVDGPPSSEAVRLRPTLSLAHPEADVAHVQLLDQDIEGKTRYLVDTTFLGLYGTATPLPPWFTEELLQDGSEDSLTKGVLDLFHHRLLSHFYRCWEKYRYYVRYRQGGSDEFSKRMLCLAGLNVVVAQEERTVPLYRMLRYAGLIVQKPTSASTLRAAIQDYFETIRAEIRQWALRWGVIPAAQHNCLGRRNNRLGRDLHLGELVKDRGGKFRIVLGPMKLDSFLGLLPGERGFRALREFVQLLVSDQLEFETELVLEKQEIPDLVLGESHRGARLGQTTWLGKPGQDEHVIVQTPREPWRLRTRRIEHTVLSPAG